MTKQEYDQLLQTLASFVDLKTYDELAPEDMRLFIAILGQVRKMTYKALKDRVLKNG